MKVNCKRREFSTFKYGELAREVVSPIAPLFPSVPPAWHYLFTPEQDAFYIFIDNLVDPHPCKDEGRSLLPQSSPGSSRCQLGVRTTSASPPPGSSAISGLLLSSKHNLYAADPQPVLAGLWVLQGGALCSQCVCAAFKTVRTNSISIVQIVKPEEVSSGACPWEKRWIYRVWFISKSQLAEQLHGNHLHPPEDTCAHHSQGWIWSVGGTETKLHLELLWYIFPPQLCPARSAGERNGTN